MATGIGPLSLDGWKNWDSLAAASAGGALSPADTGALPSLGVQAAAGAAVSGDTLPKNGAAGAGVNPALAQARAQAKLEEAKAIEGCQTCRQRQYQDSSNDPGVSFKSPQTVSPEQAASAVMGHEMEHVMHEQAKAKQEGAEVVSQSVLLHTAICPECGRTYISGGVTKTTTAQRQTQPNFNTGLQNTATGGQTVNETA